MASAEMTPVGFEPTQLALVELESTPLDHSGKVSLLDGLIDKGGIQVICTQVAARSAGIGIQLQT